MQSNSESDTARTNGTWDHSSHPEFFDYYAEQSQSEQTLQRFRNLRDTLLRICESRGLQAPLTIADIGCGAGTLALVWAEQGHQVNSLDINEPLIELARKRADSTGFAIRFDVGSATAIPWPDQSVDLCIVPELLEHITDWETCLDEFFRILKTDGLLFLSTTNRLCPKQNEFNLPLYSWYPDFLKKRCERLAITTRPGLANYAKYPAVNWFTFYSLRTALRSRGFTDFLDRFEIAAFRDNGAAKNFIFGSIRKYALLKWLAQFSCPASIIVAIK